MQEFLLDEHSMFCRDKEYCTMKDKFLFYAYNEFFIVNHYCCVSHHNRYDFYQDLISRVCDKIKIGDTYNVVYKNMRMKFDDNIISLRKDGKLLKKNIYDIHYTYCDNAGKEYCIYSEIPFFDKLCNNDELNESYKKALEYIKSKGYHECYENQLWNLFHRNLYPIDDRLCVKTSDDLIKQINQLINQKQKLIIFCFIPIK